LARPPQTPEEIIERQESEQEILAVLERLPEKSREVLVLFYIQDFSYRETAQFFRHFTSGGARSITGCPPAVEQGDDANG
jgi:hypothetical protein